MAFKFKKYLDNFLTP